MFNKIFEFTQDKLGFIYENSNLLKYTDLLILISILAVFISSTFASTDVIAVFASVAAGLTFINLLIKKGENLTCTKFEIFLILYFMIAIVSLCGSSLFALSLKGFSKIVIYFAFYLALVQYLKNNKNQLSTIILTIGGCVGFEAINGAIQTVIKPEAISTWQDTSYLNPEDIITRVYGTLQPLNPNLLGGYLVAGIPFLFAILGYFLCKKRTTYASISGALLLLAIYVLFQTGCRGAYIGLFATIVTLFIISYELFKEQYKNTFISIAGTTIMFGTAAILSVSSLRARILSIFAMRADSSNSFRFNVYQACLEMFKDNWILGIGLGNKNFREIYGLYMKTGFDALSAYNIYLEYAVESGIFALFSFVAFLILCLKDAYNFIVSNKNDLLNILAVIAAFTGIIALMMHGLVDTVFFRPQIHFLFWTMVAIIKVKTAD